MGRSLIACLLALGSSACLAQTDDLVAVVDLQYLKETGQVTAIMCYGDSPEDCDPWAHGYLFEARVRKVIHGQAPKKKFLVLYGRHAMRKQDLRGVTGRFSKLVDGTDGAEYQLAATAIDAHPTCFQWFGRDGSGPAEQPRSGELLWCFGEDRLQAPTDEMTLLRDAEQTLRTANEAYNKALIDGDVAALDEIFADEFIYTSTSGKVLDRTAQLDEFRSNTLDIASGAGSEETVQIHGRTGIVIGRFDAKGTYAGKSFDSTERYTSVWVVRDGRWKLVAEQGTLEP